MCIVIDANQGGNIGRADQPHVKVLLKWIDDGGRVATGGKLEEELNKVGRMNGLLSEWQRAGRLYRVSKQKIEARVAKLGAVCKSNDKHVIALTIEAKAKIVFTADAELISDLKNREILDFKCRIFKGNDRSPGRVEHLKALLANSDCP
ncbi:hypothetical protein AEM38_05205 [Hyphomonadaceae bacterium UKL13-1]|nr:hypothetical protein AEM38_05205 [Hyphomonadaceae bacterium UKL13-1]